eukprot:superscaffoldBa00000587_g5835
MAALDSNPKDKVEEEEEEKIYQLIYNMDSTDNMEEEEEVSSSPEQTPVYLDIDSRRRPHAVASSTKRVDMDALDSILGVPVLEVNIDSLEEKPWRRAGADISDYFNYGFDEESWKAYCKKQAKHRAAHRKKAHTKITSSACGGSSIGAGDTAGGTLSGKQYTCLYSRRFDSGASTAGPMAK